MSARVYVASSWRNRIQPLIVEALRSDGHEVYDFRNPAPGVHGFSWSEIDPNWESWTPAAYRAALQHPIARRGYGYDIAGLRWCDVCVLVLPSGRSASWELGYAMGAGKPGIVFQERRGARRHRAEAEIATSVSQLLELVSDSLLVRQDGSGVRGALSGAVRKARTDAATEAAERALRELGAAQMLYTQHGNVCAAAGAYERLGEAFEAYAAAKTEELAAAACSVGGAS